VYEEEDACILRALTFEKFWEGAEEIMLKVVLHLVHEVHKYKNVTSQHGGFIWWLYMVALYGGFIG
jgi:hypothetical protein